MKNRLKLGLLGPMLGLAFAATNAAAQGPVKGMYFPGSGILTPTPTASTNSFVDLGTDLRDSLATTSFTIELWVKMGATNSVNPVIIGNKDWNSGGNTGISLSYYASTDGSSGTGVANSLRFNFKPAGTGTRVDYDMAFPASIAQKWNHLAVTVNRKGVIQGYINGVATGAAYVPATVNIAKDSLLSLAGTLPFRLGTDGKPFGYRAPFNGTMDEVRIWKTVRTAQEIRDVMCRKLSGTETGLLAYYKMDDTGTTVRNTALLVAGSFHGTIVNGTYRVASGAPVGDSSVNVYTTSWTGQSLQLSTANRGVFTLDSFSRPGAYLHLYKIGNAPDSTTGLTPYSNNDVYFGAFTSGDTFSYYPKYNYSNYANAVSFRKTIGFFNRRTNSDSLWTAKTARYNDTTNRTMRVDSVQGSAQFFLANFISTCNQPSALSASNVQANSATLGWTTGGSALWNIQYGPSGFTLGAGTQLRAVNSNPYTLTGLQANTSHQFYVKDTCIGVGGSSWAGPFSFTTTADYGAFAGGYAMHFNGSGVQNSTVQAVNIGGGARDSIATSDFTIEMWVKVGASNTGNPPLIADKDYVSGNNTGICWTYTASVLWGDAPKRVFRFNFKPVGGARHDYDMVATNEFTWNHLAITVNRKGLIKGYINGVYQPSLYRSSTGVDTVAIDSGKTIAGIMPLYLGTDGTGNYRVPFNGDMEEVRIWNRVRTEAELRATMCQKLKGTEAGLISYYAMNEPGGTVVANTAAATIGKMNGTTVNNPARIVSPAPIGDTSVYLYPAAGWAGASLTLGTGDRGSVTVDSVANAAIPGVHVYAVNTAPNFRTGISDIGTAPKFLGVFVADDDTAEYRIRYDYNTYAAAVASSANLHLYNRPTNASMIWAQLPVAHNTASRVLSASPAPGTRQYLVADFTAPACAAPTNVTLGSLDTSSALFNWTSTAGLHNVRSGLQGFGLDTARSSVTAVNTASVSNLRSANAYEFYVQDSCGATSSSAWVGPIRFVTKSVCPKAGNVRVDSITTTTAVVKWTDGGLSTRQYTIAYGISGSFTDPVIAIQRTASSPRVSFTSLTPNTSYDFYLQSDCAASIRQSGWAGPFTFKTDSVDVSTGIELGGNSTASFSLYPNPASGELHVTSTAAGQFSLYNSIGILVSTARLNSGVRTTIATGSLPAGIYLAELRTDGRVSRQRIVIQH